MRSLAAAVLLSLSMFSATGWSATFIVTNVNDAGPGSLRQAILDANASPNPGANQPDFIHFDIPQSGLQTILLTTPLPPLTDAVTIDGYTQSDARPNTVLALGNDAVLRIELNGANIADRTAHGIDIRTSNCTIRGLVIHRFGGDGVHIGAPLALIAGNRVAGCFIGTNAAGTAAAANGNGVRIDAGGANVVGGPTPADRNIISGNTAGVVVEGATTVGNIIAGNYIGTEHRGIFALLNDFGIQLNGASGTVIFGNIIASRSPNPAIVELSATGGNALIQANRIGTDIAGQTSIGFSGIRLLTRDNTIGGTLEGAANCIAGTADAFGADAYIEFRGDGATDNTVQGNFIGVDILGTKRTGSARRGIVVGGARNVIGGTTAEARNIVAAPIGIAIGEGFRNLGPDAAHTVQGNYVGLKANGNEVITRSSGSGVHVSGDYHMIGGTAEGARNVIAGFESGIQLELANFNTIRGNYIGTNASGTAALPNSVGVRIFNPKPFNRVNRGNRIIGNVLSGNHFDGIFLGAGLSLGPEETVIQGNFIGVAADGASPLPNGGSGVVLSGAGNVVGGRERGEGNVIANSGIGFYPPGDARISGHGIQVGGSQNLTRNRITGNSIYGNVRLGINLPGGEEAPPHYVTANDTGDADTGVNELQNFPVLTSVSRSGGDVRFVGTLNSKPNGTYRIEFFGNSTVDPSGFGEGQFYLGSADVSTDASGNAAFDVTLAAPAEAHSFSTTATDAEGNTSEFSAGQGQLVNISTRAHVQTGDNVLIGGFIIAGTQPKPVIVRAIGPSLAVDGQPIAGRLEDTVLELLDASGTRIASNDNWRESQESQIRESGVPPQHEAESAIVRTLEPGAYTAIVRGKNDTSGIGLVEVYDLNQPTGSRLANISTRGFVDTGDNVLIGGFIVGPAAGGNAKVVVRALGPSLAAAGVDRSLADPIAQLRDASGTLLARNDDWKENQAAIEATGLQPADERESALVSTLQPGNYTVIVSGKNDATGVGLVELYNTQ